jgi:hypothetical protein
VVGLQEIAIFLRIERAGEVRRADEVAEHHAQVPAFRTLPARLSRRSGARSADGAAEARDGVEELAAVTDGVHAEVLQILRGETRQGFGIHRMLAEGLRVLRESEVPQPLCDIHRASPAKRPEARPKGYTRASPTSSGNAGLRQPSQ